MTEDELTTLLDRAAGPGDLPDGFTARAEKRGRRLRARNRLATATVALVTALTLGAFLLPVREEPSPVVQRFAAQVSRSEDVLLAGSLAGYDIVVLKEDPGPADSRAASLWASHGGPFRKLTDYIAYGDVCFEDDRVCANARPDNGFFAAVTTETGAVLAVVVVPPGSTLTGFDFRDGPRLPATGPLTSLTLPDATAAWDLRPAIRTPDGPEYHIPVPVGGVVHAGATT